MIGKEAVHWLKYMGIYLLTLFVVAYWLGMILGPFTGILFGMVLVLPLCKYVVDATIHDNLVYEYGDQFLSYDPDQNLLMVKEWNV